MATSGSARGEEFSEYVAALRPQLRRTAYLLCGDVHRAEDLDDRRTSLAPRAVRAGGPRAAPLRGLSVDETPADLGISPGTVKGRTWHALRRLEATLAPAWCADATGCAPVGWRSGPPRP